MLDDYPLVRPGPPKPSVIFEPRVFSLPPGTERYVVEGAGAILVPVHAGDTFTITNDEGGQPCEIVITDKSGTLSPEILGHSSTRSADGLKALLTSSDQSLRGLRMGLDARKIDLAQTIIIFTINRIFMKKIIIVIATRMPSYFTDFFKILIQDNHYNRAIR